MCYYLGTTSVIKYDVHLDVVASGSVTGDWGIWANTDLLQTLSLNQIPTFLTSSILNCGS